jgi:hypothetical protein
MQALTDILNANIETLRKGVLPEIYQKSSNLAVQRVMKGTESYRITKTTNADDFRIPLKTQPAGKFGAANLDGGNTGLGTGFAVAQFIQTYFAVKMGFQMTYASRVGSQTTDQSVVNVFKETMKDGAPNMARCEDVTFHNLGGNNGQIGIVTTAGAVSSGNQTLTMDPEFGTRLLIEGLDVEVTDSTGASTWRTSAVSPDNLPRVFSINRASRQVTLTNMGSVTVQNGDLLFLGGAVSTGPTEAWADGLYYTNTTATSGSYLGLSRTTYPSINPSAITSGGTINAQQIFALKNLIKVRGGNQSVLKLIGLASPHQLAQMSAQVQSMQFYLRDAVKQPQIDPFPTTEDGVSFGDVTHYEDLLQGSDRIDYPNVDTWLRVYLDKPGADFYRDLKGDMFFPMTATSTNAGYAFGDLFYLISTLNYANINPMLNGLITGLSTPTSDYGY